MWYGRKYRPLVLLLLPLAALYFVLWKLRDIYYRKPGREYRLACRVISVGNISVGGTGKTPFIMFLIEQLIARGITDIVVLTRGYKAEKTGLVDDSSGYGDEARMIRAKFGSVKVVSGSERYANFISYEREHGCPQVVLLDDGFQHRMIGRDADIVMVDGTALFGNGLLLPAGPLREPVRAIADRADAVFLKDAGAGTVAMLQAAHPRIPVFNFKLAGIRIQDINGDESAPESLAGKDVAAFCGIGNPGSFGSTLEKFSIPVRTFIVFDDHVRYSRSVLDSVLAAEAEYYVTTGKDAVKLKELWPAGKKLLVVEPVFRAEGDGWERILG